MNLVRESGYLYLQCKQLVKVNKKIRSLSKDLTKHKEKHGKTTHKRKRQKHKEKHDKTKIKIHKLIREHNHYLEQIKHHYRNFYRAIREEHKI